MAWQIEDHTADVVLVVEAPTLKELFEESVRALSGYIAGKETTCKDCKTKRVVQASSPDIDLILVDFLNEVLSASIVDKVLYCQAKIQDLETGNENHVVAELCGISTDWEHDVKAVTYHDLKLEKTKFGYLFKCVLDI